MPDEAAALLILDVQRYFVNEHTRYIPERVEALQADYALCFATRFVNLAGSPYERAMGWTHCRPGSEDVSLMFTLAPHTRLIEKHVYTAIDADFRRALAKARISEVHVCGLDTEACVAKNALDLFEAGLRPVVLSDACASHAGPEYHAAALKILARTIGAAQIV